MTLMLVDDTATLRRSLQPNLAEFSLELVAASRDGETVMPLFDQHHPDVVTLDFSVPHLDGMACLEEMLARNPDTRVLVIDGRRDPSMERVVRKKGASGYLAQPFTVGDLRREMATLCWSEA